MEDPIAWISIVSSSNGWRF